MDIAEKDQIKQTFHHIKDCVQYQDKLWRDTPDSYSCSAKNFVVRSDNFISFHDFLVLLIQNRMEVTKDQFQINALREILDYVQPNVDFIKNICYQIRQNHNNVPLLHQNVWISKISFYCYLLFLSFRATNTSKTSDKV